MIIGKLVEDLIQLKREYEIRYPDDNIINLACNILDRLPSQADCDEWISKNN